MIGIPDRIQVLSKQLKKPLLRLLLVISIFIYLSGMRFYPAGERNVSGIVPMETENGMGGGVIPEDIHAEIEIDLEIAGIPEPEEYSRPQMLSFSNYTLEKGDIIGNIAVSTGLNDDTIMSVNDIKNARLLQIGQVIKIPNQDGIYHTVKKDETLETIAEKYNISASRISTVNELFSGALAVNSALFIPGAKMDWVNKQEINGDLFVWPCAGYITSGYGYRKSPFDDSVRQFHSGLDIGAYIGAPIKAAMAGRVSQVGYNDSFGHYVVISHHSGYRTLYAHMNVVRAKAGAYVATGERIGDVGTSGLTTGPHVHFTVYKNGVTVNPRTLMK